ncbi:MAG: lamin tail domain-containing protein, partial [Clostridia bacterium]|nr:lamin tail domain-containing protein [Clostridia bacterium]
MKKRKRRARRELLLTAILGVALLLAGGLAQLLGGGTAGAATPPVRFCRVMTLNRGACYPVGGQYYDWLELENPGAADVSLRGWRLADGLDLRGAYVFGDVAVPAGGRLLVHC